VFRSERDYDRHPRRPHSVSPRARYLFAKFNNSTSQDIGRIDSCEAIFGHFVERMVRERDDARFQDLTYQSLGVVVRQRVL